MTVLLAALLFAAGPTAVQPAQAPATAVAIKPADGKKICRVEKGYTGSRMIKRVCLTETEWARKDAGVTAGDLKTVGAR